MYATTVSHQCWQQPVTFALKENMASEVVILGFSHIPLGKS
jgi:hypothetical protein